MIVDVECGRRISSLIGAKERRSSVFLVVSDHHLFPPMSSGIKGGCQLSDTFMIGCFPLILVAY